MKEAIANSASASSVFGLHMCLVEDNRRNVLCVTEINSRMNNLMWVLISKHYLEIMVCLILTTYITKF